MGILTATKLRNFKRQLNGNPKFRIFNKAFWVVCSGASIASLFIFARLRPNFSNGFWIMLVLICLISILQMRRSLRKGSSAGCHGGGEALNVREGRDTESGQSPNCVKCREGRIPH